MNGNTGYTNDSVHSRTLGACEMCTYLEVLVKSLRADILVLLSSSDS